jgi:glycosyltransferase involved in cell wall biosynthesis
LRDTIKRRGIKALPVAIYKRWMLKKAARVVSGVFVINSDGKKIFESEGYKNVVLMPLGFDPVYFKIDEEARQSVREKLQVNQPVIAYFGRITPEKGVKLLVEALAGMFHLEWRLMMDHFDEYVSGYNQELQQLLNSSGVKERVIFVSPDHFGIGAYMNAADIVVVPSVSAPNWKEQYGRVAAEAMACGRMVIASDSGALPELMGGKGQHFPEGNIEALRAAIEHQLKRIPRVGEHPEQEAADYAFKQLSIQKQQEVMEATFEKAGVRPSSAVVIA